MIIIKTKDIPLLHFCKNCGAGLDEILTVQEISAALRKSKSGNIFCNRSCAAKYNNKVYPKRKKQSTGKCLYCETNLYKKARYCSHTCRWNHAREQSLDDNTPATTNGTNLIGEIAEAHVLSEFVKAGKSVSIPFSSNQRYDYVVEEDGEFVRVQCKNGKLSHDKSIIRFSCCSTPYSQRSKSYHGDADVFAIYSSDLNTVYILPVEDAPSYSGTLRVLLPKSNVKSSIRMANQYKFNPDKHLLDY